MLEVLRFSLFILLGVECGGCPLCWVVQSGQDAISICNVGCLIGISRATYRMWCCHIFGCKIWFALVAGSDAVGVGSWFPDLRIAVVSQLRSLPHHISLFGVCGGCLMPGSGVVCETALLIVPLADSGYPTIVALLPGRL
ncbi:hypothetical protein Nepgr_008066 [Nepenthes gracilis]|uniref:Secreted protein n=1 Tax=Nepenthes gracilis TaxID=150966 RepID=A0AAD3XJ37_NEPGR|nr:hypothetical protein Nepgr_008066 [Nepenthes gracilis]